MSTIPPPATPGEEANNSTTLPLAKAGEGEDRNLDIEEKHAVSCKQRAKRLHSDSEDEKSTGSHIPTAYESDQPDSNDELDPKGLDLAVGIDPTYGDDIDSEFQDQGIGVEGDAFSAQMEILYHRVGNGSLS
jgi:hypothetical protein